MAVYSVHLPSKNAADVSEAAFVREGFSFGAFFLGPLWLLRRGLWLWAVLWLAGFIALTGLTGGGVLSSSARLALIFLAQLLLGLEANRLIEGRLWRKGYNLIEIITAAARDQAEMAFFRQFGPGEAIAARDKADAVLAPIRPAPDAPTVIGSLPEPETKR
ncbi:MAG: DUF2628 domain-containing protein [Roseiarcus sp.]